MAHDVFISYSSKDKPVADATCAMLESKNIRCWIAPRDIRPGDDWGEAIIDALGASRVCVLVFSSNANVSVQIKREIERAIHKGIPIIPLRIENVMPEKTLEFFLSTPHWLDAFSPPMEQHLIYLAAVIRGILDGKEAPPPPKPVPVPDPVPAAGIDRRWLLGGGAALVALAGGGYFLLAPGKPPSFVGSWTAGKITIDPGTPSPLAAFSINNFYMAAVAGGKLNATFTVNEAGTYNSTFGGDDTGTVTADGRGGFLFVSDSAHQSFPLGCALSSTAPAALLTALGGQPGQSAITLTGAGIGPSMLVGTPSYGTGQVGGIAGHWYTNTPANGPYDATVTSLDVTADGHYHYSFKFSEDGTFQAVNGQWTRTRTGSPPVLGSYAFDGNDRVLAKGGGGSVLWVRAG